MTVLKCILSVIAAVILGLSLSLGLISEKAEVAYQQYEYRKRKKALEQLRLAEEKAAKKAAERAALKAKKNTTK